MQSGQYLINGQWRSSETVHSVINPFTGRSAGEVCRTPAGEIAEACEAAAGAFETTKRLPAYARVEILQRIARGILGRKEEFARSITLETGKPIALSRGEVDRAVFTFETSAQEAGRIGGEILPLDLAKGSEGRFALVRRFPLGVVAAITPFNFPLNLVAHKVGPAIAAGNSVVLKPSSNAPGVALLLGSVVLNSGVPTGGLNIVVCAGSEAGQLVDNQHIKMISFTGSPAVGWALRKTGSRKRVSLELGGNAGVIVDESADLSLAAKKIAIGGFSNAGQSCISVQRVFVHDSCYKRFLMTFVTEVGALKVGDPFDEETVVSAMIDEASARKVEEWLEEAVAGGARIELGGTRTGALFLPTIVSNVNREMKLCTEEVFAPLVVVEPYAEFGDALRRVNQSKFGLQAGLFSNDARHIFQSYRDLEVGGVVINDSSAYRMDHMPYGGVKDSGTGKEGVRYAIEEMTELKVLALNT